MSAVVLHHDEQRAEGQHEANECSQRHRNAIAVTALMAALVHVLRTNRDGISMTLAAIVGLVLTFGPLLIVM